MFVRLILLASFGVLSLSAPLLLAAEDVQRPTVLAHMMPWFTVERDSEDSAPRYGWHWTMNHFDPSIEVDGQPQIAAHYHPLIGPYDSGDRDVIEYQLLTMKLAGIDGVIVDWYGLTDFRDYARLHRNTTRILEGCEQLGLKFVICYEDQTVPALIEADRVEQAAAVGHVVQELQWLNMYWFQSPAYHLIDGKPVLLSFGFAGLSVEQWTETISQLGFDVHYFSQNIRRPAASGGFDWPSPQQGLSAVDGFLDRAEEWPLFIPVAYPRFVDIYKQAGVGDGYGTIDDNNGRTFRATWSKATSSQPVMIQIATWNDWGEGTQIEPSIEHGYRDLEHLQSTLHPNARPADLQLPHRLLNARRTGMIDTTKLDEVRNHLTTGDVRRAEIVLDSE